MRLIDRANDHERNIRGSLNPRFFVILIVMVMMFGLFFAIAQYTIGQFGSAHVVLIQEGTLAPITGAEVALEGMTGDKPGPTRKPIRLKFLEQGGGSYQAKATVIGRYTLVVRKDGYDTLNIPDVELNDKEHKDLGRIVLRRAAPTDAAPPSKSER